MEPVTLEFLKELGKKIDTKVLVGSSEGELYSLLHEYDSDEWTMLRGPIIICDKYVVLLVRPRNDDKPVEDEWQTT